MEQHPETETPAEELPRADHASSDEAEISQWNPDAEGGSHRPEDMHPEKRADVFDPFTTIALTGFLVLVFLAITIAVVKGGANWGLPQQKIAIASYMIGHIAGLGAIIAALAWLTSWHSNFFDYLRLKKLRIRQLGLALGCYFFYYLMTLAYSNILEIKEIPESQIQVFDGLNALTLSVMLFAICIAAPIWEELVFRGFAYRGLKHSFLKEPGAIILTSAAWAFLHAQYELKHSAIIFLFGLILGMLRWYFKSTTVCIIIHALNNSIASAVTLHYIFTHQG